MEKLKRKLLELSKWLRRLARGSEGEFDTVVVRFRCEGYDCAVKVLTGIAANTHDGICLVWWDGEWCLRTETGGWSWRHDVEDLAAGFDGVDVLSALCAAL